MFCAPASSSTRQLSHKVLLSSTASDSAAHPKQEDGSNVDLLHRWASCLVEDAILNAKKRRAVTSEDFQKAILLKKLCDQARERVLAAQRAAIPNTYEEKLKIVREFKEKAMEVEDFDAAQNLKEMEMELEEAALLEAASAVEVPSLKALEMAGDLLKNRPDQFRSFLEPQSTADLMSGDLTMEVRKDLRRLLEDALVASGEAVIVEGSEKIGKLMMVKCEEGAEKEVPVKPASKERGGVTLQVGAEKGGVGRQVRPDKGRVGVENHSNVKAQDGAENYAKAGLQDPDESVGGPPQLSLEVVQFRLRVLRKIKERVAPTPNEIAEIRRANVVKAALELQQQGQGARAAAMLARYEEYLEKLHQASKSPLQKTKDKASAEGISGGKSKKGAAGSSANCRSAGLGPIVANTMHTPAESPAGDADQQKDQAALDELLEAVFANSKSQASSSSAQAPPAPSPKLVAVKQEAQEEHSSQKAKSCCCRLWLPAAVLPGGDKLFEELVGVDDSNLAHLRRKYPRVEIDVVGEASVSVPAEERLRVVAMFSGAVQPRLMLDLVDLAEAACETVGDWLGLTEDQIQEALRNIRTEKYDVESDLGIGSKSATSAPVPQKPAAKEGRKKMLRGMTMGGWSVITDGAVAQPVLKRPKVEN